MTFKEFLQLEDGFSIHGSPKVVNQPLEIIKTQIKMCKPPKDGKSSVSRMRSNDKKNIKPARLH